MNVLDLDVYMDVLYTVCAMRILYVQYACACFIILDVLVILYSTKKL
jgi:hypothetical protein